MGYATQRPLMPYPSLGTDASLTLLQTSALSTPTLQSLEILKASLRVFGGGETPEVDHRTSSISDTTKCKLTTDAMTRNSYNGNRLASLSLTLL